MWTGSFAFLLSLRDDDFKCGNVTNMTILCIVFYDSGFLSFIRLVKLMLLLVVVIKPLLSISLESCGPRFCNCINSS